MLYYISCTEREIYSAIRRSRSVSTEIVIRQFVTPTRWQLLACEYLILSVRKLCNPVVVLLQKNLNINKIIIKKKN